MQETIPQLTILVADDDPVARILTAKLLESGGFSVLSAEDGSQALSLWKRYRSSVSALITDVDMPGLGGQELASALRRHDPGFPVVLMSATPDGAAESVPGRNLPTMLPKPIRSTTLLEVVSHSLSEFRLATIGLD